MKFQSKKALEVKLVSDSQKSERNYLRYDTRGTFLLIASIDEGSGVRFFVCNFDQNSADVAKEEAFTYWSDTGANPNEN